MRHSIFLFLVFLTLPLHAQRSLTRDLDPTQAMQQRGSGFDTTTVSKTNVPEGIYSWQVDSRFGDVRPVPFDTVPHGFQNVDCTDGPTGHYNFTGNAGAPRISRLFAEQGTSMLHEPFIFLQPYNFFVRGTAGVRYTNTRSPFTNLSYHKNGNKQNGEDRITALFAVNAGKRFGMGFHIDYLYGRGYYQAQSTAHLDGNLYASYRGERYEMHLAAGHIYLKNRENGGIESDEYVNRPETFPTKYGTADMPILLDKAWNRLSCNSLFLTHKYHLGYWREQSAPADSTRLVAVADTTRTDSTRLRGMEEFVPVSSIVHTFRIDDASRRFMCNAGGGQATNTYFGAFYLPGDSANDLTEMLRVQNTLALTLNEGFSRRMKAGLRIFGRHDFRRYALPNEQRRMQHTTENYMALGAQIIKQQGHWLHYNLLGEMLTTGSKWGEFNVEGDLSLAIPLRRHRSYGDTVRISVDGFVRNQRPSFYYRHYHGRNAWWDHNDLNDVLQTRVQGTLQWGGTRITAALENVQHYTYLAETLLPVDVTDGVTTYSHAVGVRQAGHNVQMISVTAAQDLAWRILHWDNEVTWQTTTDGDITPLPALNVYSNLYVLFRFARVLRTEIGVDMRYFTRYKAPTYVPIIGQYAVQDASQAVTLGNYPIVNAYANFHLKRTRFYVRASHINFKAGAGNPFLVPHQPLNRLTIHFGLSWNFIN